MTINSIAKPTPAFFEERKFLPNEFAKWLITDSGERFVTISDTEIIHRYADGVYVPDGTIRIKQLIEQASDGRGITNRSVSEVMGHVQRRTYIDRSAFESIRDKIVVANGTLDTVSFEFSEHDPEDRALTKIGVKYDPDARCPKFEKFLSDVLKEEDEINTILELFGYCLVKSYFIQKWFMFLGTGANGKGTLLSVLKSFLGASNISAVELQGFEKPFSIAELYGKLANVVGDLSAKELYHSGRLKSLTGGDLLLAEKKFQNPFQFVNHAKLIYSANRLPKTFDGSFAFWRRVVIINFMEQFVDETDNKGLIDELTTESELSGILNLAIEGIKHLQANQGFTKNDSVEEVENFYIRNSDSIAAFFMDCVEITNLSEDNVSLQALHNAFVQYCKENRFPDTSIRKFCSDVRKDYNLMETRDISAYTGKQERVWSGIILSPDKDESTLPSILPVMTQMTEKKKRVDCTESVSIGLGERSFESQLSSSQIMEYIEKKICDYGKEDNHTYNVIEALLMKDGVSQEDAEYCINLHRQGHRVYIPVKET